MAFDNRSTVSRNKALLIVALIVTGLTLPGCGAVSRWFNDAGRVTEREVSPEVLLTNYRWFKQAGAQLSGKMANIENYKSRISKYERDYGSNRREWPIDVREEDNKLESEIAGLKQSYNSLAAQYNALSDDIFAKYAKPGQPITDSNGNALPRKFAEYQ